jgi:hypothetical protein
MVERWRLEHQYIRAKGRGALVESTGIHDSSPELIAPPTVGIGSRGSKA